MDWDGPVACLHDIVERPEPEFDKSSKKFCFFREILMHL
jgi:hypothetical protein